MIYGLEEALGVALGDEVDEALAARGAEVSDAEAGPLALPAPPRNPFSRVRSMQTAPYATGQHPPTGAGQSKQSSADWRGRIRKRMSAGRRA